MESCSYPAAAGELESLLILPEEHEASDYWMCFLRYFLGGSIFHLLHGIGKCSYGRWSGCGWVIWGTDDEGPTVLSSLFSLGK
ncbi:hypothetical protein Pint_32972 [Pistacia integerrima]|uniref:Uncharacterized protein n=1 Tax=Pistacia integerrima TaxID=434235 RepID=A0ACC0X1Z9_9ROSI|nr:hypothetical protein Pint_32972 [Pistacia integerrima]